MIRKKLKNDLIKHYKNKYILVKENAPSTFEVTITAFCKEKQSQHSVQFGRFLSNEKL